MNLSSAIKLTELLLEMPDGYDGDTRHRAFMLQQMPFLQSIHGQLQNVTIYPCREDLFKLFAGLLPANGDFILNKHRIYWRISPALDAFTLQFKQFGIDFADTKFDFSWLKFPESFDCTVLAITPSQYDCIDDTRIDGLWDWLKVNENGVGFGKYIGNLVVYVRYETPHFLLTNVKKYLPVLRQITLVAEKSISQLAYYPNYVNRVRAYNEGIVVETEEFVE